MAAVVLLAASAALVGAGAEAGKQKPRPGATEPATQYGDYLAGRLAQLDHDWKTAGQRIRRAWEQNRDDSTLRHDALLLSVAGGDFAGATGVARTVPADSSEEPLAVFLLALDDLVQGRYDAAAAKLAANERSGIDRYINPVMVAWANVGRGNAQAARASLARLDGLEGAGEMQALQSGMVAEATGDYAKAAELYGKLLDSKPSAHALSQIAYFYMRRGQADLAKSTAERLDPEGGSASLRIELLTRLSQKGKAPPAPDPRTGAADALFQVAASLSEQKQADIAPLLYAQFALFLAPGLPSAQIVLAEIGQRWGRNEDGLATLLTVDPKSDLKTTADRLAMSLADKAGQTEAALKIGQEAVKAHPEDYDLILTYADLLRQKQHFPEAIANYDAALTRIPQISNRRGLALYHRGIAYQQAHQWPHAESDLLAALQLRPDDPGLLNYLAFSWADQGINLDRARTMLERAVQLLPDDGAIVDSLGWVMFRAGDYDDAVKQLEKAVSLDSGDAVINDHLGDAYWRVGRQIEARGQWEKASRLSDDKALTGQIQNKLRNGLDPASTPRNAAAN
jgi:tetratricopeptide (TPR) repeat protein